MTEFKQPNYSLASDEELLESNKLMKKEMKRRGIPVTERVIIET